jgi:hypothetical protein
VAPRFIAALSALFVFAAAPAAHACGSAGYSYAGVSTKTTVSGVGATLTSLAAPAVQNGHVAGWVGVGGPGLGPNHTSEWIQVGYSGFPGLRAGSLYYEVALPGANPRYHEVSSTIHAGATHRVAVLEVAHHANWWRVWVDGHAVSRAYHLPGSHGAWRGIATAENWGGGMRACNLYSYRFNRVRVTHNPGGSWRLLSSAYRMRQGENRLVPASSSSFVARTSTLPSPERRPTPSAADKRAAKTSSARTPTAATAPTTPVDPPVATDAVPPADNPAAATPVDAAQPDDSATTDDATGPGFTP